MLNTNAHHLPLAPHTVHIYSVGHDFALHLLVLGIFNQSLVFTCAALTEAAETEDEDSEEDDAADDADDDVLCGLGQAVPLLGHGLRGGVRTIAIEGDRFGVTAENVSIYTINLCGVMTYLRTLMLW